jgi:hypothetical protein
MANVCQYVLHITAMKKDSTLKTVAGINWTVKNTGQYLPLLFERAE